MKTSELNRQTMVIRVDSCLDATDFALALAPITEYPPCKVSLGTNIGWLDQLQKKQFTNLRFLIVSRNAGRTKTIAVDMKLSAALKALAIKTENQSLLDEATFTKTSLTRLSFNQLAAKTQTLFGLATTYSAQLGIYGLTPAIIDTMETTISDFVAAINAAEAGKDDQKQITADISKVLDTIEKDDIYRISLMVDTLKDTHPALYERFAIAKRVINTGGANISAKGKVIDFETGQPVPNCKIMITSAQPQEYPVPAGEQEPVEKKKTASGSPEFTKSVKISSQNGGWWYKNLPDGAYELTAFKMGFTEQRMQFFVNTGEITQITVRLQKLKTAVA
jgi:hypothetical protein